MINIEDFAKVEMKVGTVVNVEDIEGSEKLLKLTVDFGEENPRQVLSGIKLWFGAEDLKDKQFVFVTNLEPRKMMGHESQAMIMAAEGDDKPIPIVPSAQVPNGSKLR